MDETTDSNPRAEGFRAPGDWEPHRRCWMAWPCRTGVFGPGDDPVRHAGALQAAREVQAEVAKAIAPFEPVTMVARSEFVAEVSMMCGGGVSTLPLDQDDSWIRDTGPSFLVSNGANPAGVAWRFNGWGDLYPDYEEDARMAARLLDHLEMRRFDAPFVLEPGSVQSDGEGTVLATEECLLHPSRNPDLARPDIETALRDHLGAETVIWLGDGMRDDDRSGHIDNIALFARPGVVLVAVCGDGQCPDRDRIAENLNRLKSARDARGRAFEIIETPLPKPRERHDGARLTASYVSLYIANGAVIMPAFDDPHDERAREAAREAFPDHQIVMIGAEAIVQGGAGLHAITLGQPAV